MQIRLMTSSDVPVGMKLGTQNGWNQLDRDWLRFLEMQPDGCFIAEANGAGVGTACACIFGPVAWVALVLVDSSCRNQGIGTALMKHVLNFLDERRIPTIRLDATPLGRPIYEKLGFTADYELARYEGVLPASSATVDVDKVTTDDVEAICKFDEAHTGTDRSKFLRILFREDSAAFRVVLPPSPLGGEGLGVRGLEYRESSPLTPGPSPRSTSERVDLVGYLASRRGARATQIGPAIANENAGTLLFAEAFQRLAGQRVYIDIPLENESVQRIAQQAGLSVQRHLLRMTRGQRISESIASLWASSGPEKG